MINKLCNHTPCAARWGNHIFGNISSTTLVHKNLNHFKCRISASFFNLPSFHWNTYLVKCDLSITCQRFPSSRKVVSQPKNNVSEFKDNAQIFWFCVLGRSLYTLRQNFIGQIVLLCVHALTSVAIRD